jgi:hypothetical protein
MGAKMLRSAAFRVAGDRQTKIPAPVPDGFVGNVNPALCGDFLHLPKAKVEAKV